MSQSAVEFFVVGAVGVRQRRIVARGTRRDEGMLNRRGAEGFFEGTESLDVTEEAAGEVGTMVGRDGLDAERIEAYQSASGGKATAVWGVSSGYRETNCKRVNPPTAENW